MNATNRVVNRVVLLMTGVLLISAGAIAVVAVVGPSWADGARAMAMDRLAAFGENASAWTVVLPGAGPVPAAFLIAAASAVVIVILLIVFIATRGGGRTRSVLQRSGADGALTVDRSVADAVLTAPLRERADVLAARTDIYLVRRAPAILLGITPRRGAVPADIVAAADSAVADWDAIAGERIPVVVHLAGRGWIDRLRSATRLRTPAVRRSGHTPEPASEIRRLHERKEGRHER